MKYKILQIKDLEKCPYAFCHKYKTAKDLGFNLDDYVVVYEGNIEPEDDEKEVTLFDYLENLFYIFNCDHPADFKGHSLSCSDIIELDGVKYYVDGTGWTEVKP